MQRCPAAQPAGQASLAALAVRARLHQNGVQSCHSLVLGCIDAEKILRGSTLAPEYTLLLVDALPGLQESAGTLFSRQGYRTTQRSCAMSPSLAPAGEKHNLMCTHAVHLVHDMPKRRHEESMGITNRTYVVRK